MNFKNYHWILYLIAITIIATIAIQFYWNYKNYEQNKQNVLNEIQASLDNAVDEYYTNLSAKNFLTIVEPENPTPANRLRKNTIWKEVFANKTSKEDTLKNKLDVNIMSLELRTDTGSDYKKTDSILIDNLFEEAQHRYAKHLPTGKQINQILQLGKNDKNGIQFNRDTINKTSEVKVFKGIKARDSLKLIKNLKAVYIAIHNDSLAYNELDSLFSKRLQQKKIDVQFAFKHFKKDTLFFSYDLHDTKDKKVIFNSNSSFFNGDQKLQILHTSPSKEALKRSSTGILLSLLLALAVISSLFYLLKIINQQKELAEIKNDLISNITHEFKTPIATVATAVEALENFNAVNDKERTKKYLSISNVQLKKLHSMVEKLLETATLDSEKLLLNKEKQDIVSLTEKLVNKHKLIAINKNIKFSSNTDRYELNIDHFHFENAVSNLIDNAIKYGGTAIEVSITGVLNTVEIAVADNGKGIDKQQQEKIFDKFYRIPKGNTHDVKGFGIGLYYTKKIIEKHNGTVSLVSNSNNTIFKISLPGE